MSQSRPSTRPTTPLRRISAHSLRSLSLSHSQTQHLAGGNGSDRLTTSSTTTTSTTLSHLGPLFAELSDAVSDLCANLDATANLAKNLDQFNEGFASYLYGLRINSYTFDFKHPPNKINFELAHERRQLEHELQLEHLRQEAQDDSDETFGAPTTNRRPSTPGDEFDGDRTATVGDSTFVTNDENSFTHEPISRTTTTTRGGARGGAASGIARGRGRGRGGIAAAGAMTRRKKEEIAAFADPVFPLLPINLRENRRNECEKVLWALKEHPTGLGLGDLTKQFATLTPAIPQVRINEVLLALVRAKVATKGLVKGVNVYKLDRSRIG
ncbi:DASH complex subunit DAM1 [Sporobolomyces koalae]|uniref:DASH complex subunit DAM1 n=1 Tax=Sporobolomyces koalae TaxID=500713 RepID=UPI00316F4F6E